MLGSKRNAAVYRKRVERIYIHADVGVGIYRVCPALCKRFESLLCGCCHIVVLIFDLNFRLNKIIVAYVERNRNLLLLDCRIYSTAVYAVSAYGIDVSQIAFHAAVGKHRNVKDSASTLGIVLCARICNDLDILNH